MENIQYIQHYAGLYRTVPDVLKQLYGAQKRTRTSTALRPLRPERSASTNSAIWALHFAMGVRFKARVGFCQRDIFDSNRYL